ncbi:MAG: gliding motility-associated C-terminal domain-containing protein [Flavobacteriales bacterium]|nr:gliding motility-associated C-terminal domain-containing protein [Flavobacteriales bacterium]
MTVKIYSCLFLLVSAGWCSVSHAQNATNKGILHIASGTTFFLGGDFTNDAAGATENHGDIILDGDWVNHGSFLDTVGTVSLTGANQLITGSVSTTFNNLNALGTGIKRMTLDATVTDTLRLNDRELATDSNTLFVTNADTASITRSTGFVSSLDTGSLSRATITTSTYLFPVGSSIGTPRYRPVEISPTSTSAHIFSVRMANVDPTTEGYNIANKQPGIGAINANWYHRINRTSGTSPVDLTIFKDILELETVMVHWETEWENVGVVATSPTSVTKIGWNDFSPDPFALAEEVLVVNAGNDTTICPGVDVQLQVAITGGIGPYSYAWSPGTNLNDSTIANPLAANVSAAITYSVSVYDSGTSSWSLPDTVVITVNPTYTINTAASFCFGDSVLLPGGGYASTAATYSDTLTTIAGCDSIINTTVSVNATYVIPASASFCPGDSVLLPGGSYVLTAGTFNDTLSTIAGCDSVIATTVTVNSTYLTPAATSICSGDSVQLPGGSYVLTAGTFNDTLTTISGCDSIISTTVTLDSIYFSSAATSICQGDSVQLPGGSYTSTAGTFINTLTTMAGCDSIIATTVTIDTVYFSSSASSICQGDSLILPGGTWVTGANTYYDTLVGITGCDSIIETILTIQPSPNASISGPTNICSGASAVLTASGGSVYQWSTGATSSSITVSPLSSMTYSVVVSDPGCPIADSTTLTVNVNNMPAIAALPDLATIVLGESVDLTASGGVSYIWTPQASLDDPFSSNPIASPSETTLYYVLGTDINGCSNTDSILVTVSQDFAIGVPNIFSPNGDFQNDVLYVSERGLDWMLLIIYDRWGEKVFESNDVNTGWDGTFKGKSMNPAVYVYYLEGVFTNSTEIKKQGNITLVR